MRKYISHAVFVLVALAIGFSLGHFRIFGQANESSDPMFGTWAMDQSKSVNNRGGNHAPYLTQSIRILTHEGEGFRMSLATSPAGAPLVYTGKFDGKDYPDPRSRRGDETLAHWRATPSVIVRLKKTAGVPSEVVIYTVSLDGGTFVSTSWDPAHPELEDLQVFHRAK